MLRLLIYCFCEVSNLKLSFNKIKEIVTGAARIEEKNETVKFYRFTKEQEEMYKVRSSDYYNRSFCTSGIKLLFKTNSKSMFLKITVTPRLTRSYFSLDVFVNGKVCGYIDNLSDLEPSANYIDLKFKQSVFEKSFDLGEGEKTVCVHLPWSLEMSLDEIHLDDGAFCDAIKPPKKLIAFGDSITHGYDALRPSNRYVAKLADSLCAEEFNKAIGGELFYAPLASLGDSFIPDYITVAYGTNDWNCIDEDSFKVRCRDFLTNLRKTYPTSKIFVITPIWRKDMCDFRKFGDFKNVEKDIFEIANGIEGITVISGFDFVPKDEKFYADLRLHPNDIGFEHYFNCLYERIKSVL